MTDYFTQHDVEFEIEDGMALLKEPYRGYESFGLINLGQACRLSPPEDFFDLLNSLEDQNKK